MKNSFGDFRKASAQAETARAGSHTGGEAQTTVWYFDDDSFAWGRSELVDDIVQLLDATGQVSGPIPGARARGVGPDPAQAGRARRRPALRGRIREQQARGRGAVLLASDRYFELHERLSAAAAKPPTTEAVDQQASQALPPLVHKAWRRLAKRAEVVLEDGSGPPGVRRTPNGTRCLSPPSGPGMRARRSRPCSARRPLPSPTRWRSSRRSWANTRTLLTLAQRSGSSRRAQTRRPASPSACSTRPNASGLQRPAAGSRRCGPKSAAASGADG
jgi:hypothetical protein